MGSWLKSRPGKLYFRKSILVSQRRALLSAVYTAGLRSFRRRRGVNGRGL